MTETTKPIRDVLIEKFTALIDGPLTLSKAIAIATVAHSGQEDKGQNSYIRHPLRVMEKMDSEDEMAAAVCHDVLEDTFLKREDLIALGFTETQTKSIVAVSRIDGETYEELIQRAKKSYTGRKMKKHDIIDNLDIRRLKNRRLTTKDMERQQRYIDALVELGEQL